MLLDEGFVAGHKEQGGLTASAALGTWELTPDRAVWLVLPSVGLEPFADLANAAVDDNLPHTLALGPSAKKTGGGIALATQLGLRTGGGGVGGIGSLSLRKVASLLQPGRSATTAVLRVVLLLATPYASGGSS